MIRSIQSLETSLESILNSHIPALCPLYKIACTIFHQLAMTFQYVTLFGYIFIRQCRWLPSPFPRKNMDVYSRNIPSLTMLKECLRTVGHPIPKEQFSEVGRPAGLRVSHDLVYQPANGICLGMAFTFLSNFYRLEGDVKSRLCGAARVLSGGGNEQSLRVQALYEALMSFEGSVRGEDKRLFDILIKGESLFTKDIKGKEWVSSVEAFLRDKEKRDSLRHFVLDDLEKRGVEITTDLYSLVLEMDTYWHHHLHPTAYKNDALHDAITQTIAKTLQMEILHSMRVEGEIGEVKKQIATLAPGEYFIQFPRHTVVLVKSENGMAFFNSSEGMSWTPILNQQEALLQLLGYYGSSGKIAARVILFKNSK